MAWKMSGDYMETCNCTFLCPCLPSNMVERPTEGDCKAAVALRIGSDFARVGEEHATAFRDEKPIRKQGAEAREGILIARPHVLRRRHEEERIGLCVRRHVEMQRVAGIGRSVIGVLTILPEHERLRAGRDPARRQVLERHRDAGPKIAVPEAGGVFGQAIKNMSVADAKAILVGTNNAATQYFRTATETNLFEKFLPIVKKATDQTGVTSAYKRLMEKAEGGSSLGGFGSFGFCRADST